jgi:hypothetical protein
VPLGGVAAGSSFLAAAPSDSAQREQSAAALGYAAALLALLEHILDVPLRYGVQSRGSRSGVHDRAAAQLAAARRARDGDALWHAPSSLDLPELRAWQPLYWGGGGGGGTSERDSRYAAAAVMLSRDAEQLLHAFALRGVEQSGGGGGAGGGGGENRQFNAEELRSLFKVRLKSCHASK